jgi:guanosine-3',5'-bis(diphosphate) 3'-pyrophosphohydrolase
MQDIVSEAARFAADAHNRQFRKFPDSFGFTEPYICHPARVAGMVAVYHPLFKPERLPVIMSAAWLHDVIEDTNTSLATLIDKFGDVVAGIVGELTKPSARGRGFEKDLIHYGTMSRVAKIIKMLDRIDNIRSLVNAPAGYARLYLEESYRLLNAIRDADHSVGDMFLFTIDSASRFFDAY